MSNHILHSIACCLLGLGMVLADEAPVQPWPMDITLSHGVITLYQPQPERLEGNILYGRAAASYLATGKPEEERQFGALWMTATLDIDRENDVAKTRSLVITKVVTPKGEKSPDDGAAARQAIQDAVVAKGFEIDLDRLIATVEEPGATKSAEYRDQPPRILIRHEPTVLVMTDGKADVREAAGVKRVVNSPAFLALDASGTWWLLGDRDWLTAPDLSGPWTLSAGFPPAAVETAAKQAGYSATQMRTEGAQAPKVIVVEEPTELVVFAGKPEYEPLGAGSLLVAQNTDTTVMVEVASGQHYLLLAGRWYRAATLADAAAWEPVKPDALPAAFGEIPAEPEWSAVRASVAGTPEADEALVQQQIPQTARIPRTATITVTFDGEPKWVAIKDLAVDYAENSADAVFRIAGPQYYACRDGVWYESKDVAAPFIAATSVPDALRRLPADCPWHNCSYVEVYESTTEYIWCGYTPGYLGWYSWCGCPIYGTGYWYRGWYGPVVYPRPVTWGVGIHYNPWTGWGVTVGVGGPHWSIGISSGGGHYHGGGWWGCGGINNIDIDIDNSNTINVGNGDRVNHNMAQRPAIYDRVPGAQRPALKESGDRLRATTPTASTRPARENLAVDRDGTIARPTPQGGWQTREQGAWKDKPKPETKPAERRDTKPASKRPAPSHERTQQMRSRGEARVQQRSRPVSRPSGGGRGGGGRGR